MLGLGACASETRIDAAAPQAGVSSTSEADFLYLHEEGEAKSVWRAPLSGARGDAPGEKIEVGPGDHYPGPSDPRGTHLLVIQVQEAPHRESGWLVPRAGGPAVQVVPPANELRSPSWSPDGSWLYAAWDGVGAPRRGPRSAQSPAGGAASDPIETGGAEIGGSGPSRVDPQIVTADIFRFPRDGGEPARLTSARHGSFEPAAGPGGQVCFGSSRDGNAEIYVMEADGSAQRRLTDHTADDVRPRWRNREEIGFISHRSGSARVWLMRTDTPNPRLLRPEVPGEEDLDLLFSPDGARVAVTLKTGPREVDLEIVEVESGRIITRIAGPGPDEHPAWSADSQQLLVTSSRSGDPEIWWLTADGAEVRRLTEREGADWLGRWGGAAR